jgi:hypothetical protein
MREDMLHFAPHKKRRITGMFKKPELLANRLFLCIKCRRGAAAQKTQIRLCDAVRPSPENHKNTPNQPLVHYRQDVRVYYTVNLSLTYTRTNLGKGGAKAALPLHPSRLKTEAISTASVLQTSLVFDPASKGIMLLSPLDNTPSHQGSVPTAPDTPMTKDIPLSFETSGKGLLRPLQPRSSACLIKIGLLY